ncbi:MAG: TonB-dependent receptor plug domain-containing protein, partial [Flavobacteriales bacterium]
KDKTSFYISGRRTYVDLIASPFINDSSPFKGSGYFFYDMNFKVDHKFSKTDNISLNGYVGRDKFNFVNNGSDFKVDIPWGNSIATLKWNHVFNDSLILESTAIFSDYRFEFDAEQSQFNFNMSSGIQSWGLKNELKYNFNSAHTFTTGIKNTYHIFSPTSVDASSGESDFSTGEERKIHAFENAIYIQDEFNVMKLLKVNAGLRFSSFHQVGPFTRYKTDQFSNPIDSTTFETLEEVKSYYTLVPRFNARYSLSPTSSVKGSFSVNRQFVHLTSLSPISLPTDVWIPSSSKTKPQKGIQYSAGYYRNFKNDTFQSSLEVFYKDMDNLTNFKNGTQPENTVGNNIDNKLTYGTGRAYGMELFFKKKKGALTGWIGYTLSKSTRKFEKLNNGERFPYEYDRRHDLSIVASYDL